MILRTYLLLRMLAGIHRRDTTYRKNYAETSSRSLSTKAASKTAVLLQYVRKNKRYIIYQEQVSEQIIDMYLEGLYYLKSSKL